MQTINTVTEEATWHKTWNVSYDNRKTVMALSWNVEATGGNLPETWARESSLRRIWFKTYSRTTKTWTHLSCMPKLNRLIAVTYLLEEGTIKLDNTRTFIWFHNNLQVHQQLLLFLLINSWAYPLQTKQQHLTFWIQIKLYNLKKKSIQIQVITHRK
jgi:hypothetical protein